MTIKKILSILFCCLCIVSSVHLLSQTDQLNSAYSLYQEAEKTKDLETRRKGFNEALRQYLQLEGDNPSGNLCYNIGNCYYQLGEYGLSILYYYKAQKLLPRNQMIRQNLDAARKKAGLPDEPYGLKDSIVNFFSDRLSIDEVAGIAFWLFAFAFVMYSFYLWVSFVTFRRLSLISFFLGLLIFLSFIWSQHFTYPKACVIRTVGLRIAPGQQYALQEKTPVLWGTKVTILDVDSSGWVKISLNTNEVGYVPIENIRAI